MSTDAVRYAVLGLIAGSESGAHGYQLKLQFDALCGELWTLNFGQMYRTLERLERASLIRGVDQLQTGRPSRRVFRVTSDGRRRLDAWLLHPPSHEPQPPRDDLSIRLLFLPDARLAHLPGLIGLQRALYRERLARLDGRRPSTSRRPAGAGFAAELLRARDDMRLRSDLAWLDLLESAVRGRLAAAARDEAAPGGS